MSVLPNDVSDSHLRGYPTCLLRSKRAFCAMMPAEYVGRGNDVVGGYVCMQRRYLSYLSRYRVDWSPGIRNSGKEPQLRALLHYLPCLCSLRFRAITLQLQRCTRQVHMPVINRPTFTRSPQRPPYRGTNTRTESSLHGQNAS